MSGSEWEIYRTVMVAKHRKSNVKKISNIDQAYLTFKFNRQTFSHVYTEFINEFLRNTRHFLKISAKRNRKVPEIIKSLSP